MAYRILNIDVLEQSPTANERRIIETKTLIGVRELRKKYDQGDVGSLVGPGQL
jgi:hypothetical protein